jgi:hypothetical protein
MKISPFFWTTAIRHVEQIPLPRSRHQLDVYLLVTPRVFADRCITNSAVGGLILPWFLEVYQDMMQLNQFMSKNVITHCTFILYVVSPRQPYQMRFREMKYSRAEQIHKRLLCAVGVNMVSHIRNANCRHKSFHCIVSNHWNVTLSGY